MKSKVYIESSVISYLTARASRDIIVAGRQAITCDWWDNHKKRFDVYISALVIEEICQGDVSAAKLRLNKIKNIQNLKVTNESLKIAKLLLLHKAVPFGSEDDALHIGIASSQSIDYLLTWNFKHINNAETKLQIIDIIESCGYVCPLLCSPEELGGFS